MPLQNESIRIVMKKLLLIAAAFFSIISATAQTPNNYPQKLDSVVYYGEAVERLEYDNRLNCTKIEFEYFILDEPNEILSTHQFTYDDNNRVTKTEHWSFIDDSYESYEIAYNDAGLVSEKVRTYVLYNHDYMVDYDKCTYEYAEDGTLLHTKGFHLNEANEWIEYYRNDYFYEDSLLITIKKYRPGDNSPVLITKYTYNDQRLCTEITKTQNYDIYKALYTYDELGRKLSETIMEEGDDNELVYTEKHEYEYNTSGDCTNYTHYEYIKNNASWMRTIGFEFAYDLSTSVANIAGIETYWNYSIETIAIDFHHKPLSYALTFDDGTISEPNIIHYSDATGIFESTENQLNVWPNPVDSILYLETKDLQQVDIFSLDGKKVLTLTNGFEEVNVKTISNGCYLLKATKNNGKTITQRFIKHKVH